MLLFAVCYMSLSTVMLVVRREEVRAKWLAFVSLRDGEFDVYRINIESGEIKRITTSAGVKTALAWSPNASDLIYTRTTPSGQNIESINWRSKAVSVLLRDRNYVNRVSWAGDTIAFDEFADGQQSDIFGLKVGSTRPYPITVTDVTEIYPEITPDGDIIYAAIRNEERASYGLYTMSGSTIIENEYSYLNQSLSPDGQMLVASRFFQRNFELVKIDIQTGEETQLDIPQPDPGLPRWSPDGRWIAYVAIVNSNFDIYITDGNEVRQITDHPLFDSSPAWMPVVDRQWDVGRLSGGILLMVGLQLLVKPVRSLFR
jgi:Tol biopolymer transport system component